MISAKSIFSLMAIFVFSGCSTIGDVAQSVADKAKGNSTESKSATAPPPPSTANSASPATQKTQPVPKSADVTSIPDSGKEFQYGGYKWLILSRSEAGIRIQSRGWAGDQVALDAASLHCKKFGRIAQQVGTPQVALMVFVVYNFNCVR